MEYTSRQLTKEFDVTSRTLRHYEQQGILAPNRIGTTRRYTQRDRIRLMLTIRGRSLGFSLQECRELFDIYDQASDGSSQQMWRYLEILEEKRAELEKQAEHIQAVISEIRAAEAKCRLALKKKSA